MIVKEILPNGITLLTEAMPHVRSVAVGVWLKRGSRHETPLQSGISHFIEHMVFKGTKNRSAEVIAAQVDSIGGHMDAFTAKEYASFHLKVLDEHLPLAVDILGDIAMNPLFDPSEMTKEKKVIFEEINMVEDTPDDLVMELFTEAFWPRHPLGRPILGTKSSVSRFRRDELAGFFRSVYRPGNIVIAAAGHLEHGATSRLVRRHFGELAPGGKSHNGGPPRPASRIVTRSKKELEQVHLCLGSRGFPQQDIERYAAALFNSILGGGMSSRLFQRIREKEGLVYTVLSYHNGYLNGGYEAVYAACVPRNLRRVLSITLEEMKKIKADGVTATELGAAKLHLKGSILLSLESTVSRMSGIARQEYYFGRQFTADEIIAAIDAVTLEDIHAVAQTIVDPDSLSLTLLGNLKSPGISMDALREAVA